MIQGHCSGIVRQLKNVVLIASTNCLSIEEPVLMTVFSTPAARQFLRPHFPYSTLLVTGAELH